MTIDFKGLTVFGLAAYEIVMRFYITHNLLDSESNREESAFKYYSKA